MAAAQKPQNAIQLLTSDHREVEGLFERFKKAGDDAQKQKLAHQICTELKVHAMVEEEIFYPALRGKVDDDMLDEAIVEHDGAKMLINEIEAGDPSEDFYEAKVKVLQEQIEHHIKEEEKESGNMFSEARKTDIDMDELGSRMLARKEELMRQAEGAVAAPAEPSTFTHLAETVEEIESSGDRSPSQSPGLQPGG